MSWEDQGRQYHQWFGHGTAGGTDAGPGTAGTDGARDVAGAVGAAAVATLGGARGRALAGVLAAGGARDLADALPVWVAASGWPADRFRALVVGPGFGVAGAALLQAMARVVARSEASGSGDDAKVAGAHLAAALSGERQAEWGYKLNYARDMADYAAVNGMVPGVVRDRPETTDMERGLVHPAQYAVPFGPGPLPIIPRMVPGSPENERLTLETIRDFKAILKALGHIFQSEDHLDDDEHDEIIGRRQRLKPKPAPPKPESGDEPTPPAGGMRRLNESELKDAAEADGYDSVERWKQKELKLKSTSDIVKDNDGNLYSVPRQGTGVPVPLHIRMPNA